MYGVEIDIIRERNQKLQPIEVKSSETFQTSFLDNLFKFETVNSPQTDPTLVYCGEETFTQKKISVQSWEQFCLKEAP